MGLLDLLSWNVNGRVDDAAQRQIERVLERRPDVVALQEVTTRSYPAWRDGLSAAGYAIVSTVDLLELPYPPPPYSSPPLPPPPPPKHIQRKYANLTAVRHSIVARAGLSFDVLEEERLAFPEKYLAVGVSVGGVTVLVHNAHLPPGVSRGLLKVHAFEAIRRRVDADLHARDTESAVVLCGDFNAPVTETVDEPRSQIERAWHGATARWQAAEASVIEHPEMRDAYRGVHEPGQPLPASHFTGRPARTPHRYDHIFVSRKLRTVSCEYLGNWLRDGLSDHAAVVATLSLPESAAVQ